MGKPNVNAVGGNQPNGIFEGFVEIQNEAARQPQNVPQAQNVPEPGDIANEFDIVDANDIPGRDALQGAAVGGGNMPQSLATRLHRDMPVRYTLGNWFKNAFRSLGRAFVSIHHTLWGLRQPKTADANFYLQHDQTFSLPKDAWENPLPVEHPADNRTEVQYSVDEIGAALGIRHPILRPFAHAAGTTAEDIVYPHGHPRLDDVRQDPDLQDCWFLSSVSSLLVARGALDIKKMIELPADPDAEGAVAKVRLGKDNVYLVPFGEIRGNNGKHSAVSHSAPWVQLLEQAMQMHLLKTHGTDEILEGYHRLANRDVGIGLYAVLGLEGGIMTGERLGDAGNVTDMRKKLQGLHHHGHPVVLASPPDKKGLSLRTGISPGHAVALLDIDGRSDTAFILDPYGKVKSVRIRDLADFMLFTEPDPEPAPQDVE